MVSLGSDLALKFLPNSAEELLYKATGGYMFDIIEGILAVIGLLSVWFLATMVGVAINCKPAKKIATSLPVSPGHQ